MAIGMGKLLVISLRQGTTCASEFDRSFILSAIEAWYGTRENFQNYVRGPLREQLLQLFPSPHLPCSYVALILCSMMAYSLDIGLSIYKAGASMKVIMKQLLCTFTFFGIWFWAAFNGIFYLSDRTAGKDATGQHRWKCLCDCGRTFLVALAIFLWTLVGFAVMIACIRSTNLVFACCWAFHSEMGNASESIMHILYIYITYIYILYIGYTPHYILIPSLIVYQSLCINVLFSIFMYISHISHIYIYIHTSYYTLQIVSEQVITMWPINTMKDVCIYIYMYSVCVCLCVQIQVSCCQLGDQITYGYHLVLVPSGKHTKSYWKWWFIVDFPIKSGAFP